MAIGLAAALLAQAATASARPDGAATVREVARLLAVAAADDLAEDALYRQIQTWKWPAPKPVRLPREARRQGRWSPAATTSRGQEPGGWAPGRTTSRGRNEARVSGARPASRPAWAYGSLDVRSRSYLHLGDLGAPFPLDPDDTRLSDAARRVGRYAPLRALTSLKLALRSPDGAVRAQAALALGWARDPGAEPFVVGLLADREASVRARAAEALGVMDDRAARPRLERTLGDRSQTVQIFAARALGHLGDPRALEALRTLVRSPVPAEEPVISRGQSPGAAGVSPAATWYDQAPAPVRRAAWEAIARLGGHGTASVLRDALGDPAVRYGRLAYSLYRAALPAELRDLADKGVDEEAIRQLAAAAGQGADASGLALLAADLADPDPVLRRAAVAALGAARNPLSTDPLLRSLRDHDGQVRGLAVQALAGIGNPRTAEALAGALGRGDARTAGIDQAGPAIVRLADPRVLPALLGHVRGPNPVVAADALLPVGRLGDFEEAPAVAAALSHPHPQVRAAAARAVADLAEVGAARERFVSCGDWGRTGLLTDADLAIGPGASGVGPGAGLPSAGSNGGGASGCALRSLLALAKDPVPAVRMAATSALGRLGDGRAYGALYDAARDRDAGVADAARIALGAVGVRHAADPLAKAAHAGSAAAAHGLAALGPDAAAVRIAGLLGAPDPATRGQAAGALRDYWEFGMGGQDGADGAAAARLAKALWDPDRGVRIQAALALSEFPGNVPAAALGGAVSRSNPFVRVWFAAAGMRQGGGNRGKHATGGWSAVREALESPDAELRRATLEAIAWMRAPEGAHLAAPLFRDRDLDVRDAAAVAAVHSPGPEGVRMLAELIGGGSWRPAVRALDAMDGRDYRVQALVDAAAENRDIRVRWAAERLAMRAERFDIQIDRAWAAP